MAWAACPAMVRTMVGDLAGKFMRLASASYTGMKPCRKAGSFVKHYTICKN
jgi:hypothetical protein